MAGTAGSRQPEVDLHRSVAYLLASVTSVKLKGKQAAVHRAFYRVTQEFPNLLPGMAFSRGPGAPYSKALERVLFCLASSRLLSLSNPSFDEMEMTKEKKSRIKAYYGPRLGERTADLERAAKTLEVALRIEDLEPAA